MIYLELRIYVFIALAACSRGLPLTDQNVPSQITMNENFKEPIPVLSTEPSSFVSNFVHQGTNYFFNPQMLLGTFVPPQIGRFVATVNENIIETPVITEVPELPDNNTQPKQITPKFIAPILINESIIVPPPFPPPILVNDSIIVPPPFAPPILVNDSIIVPPPFPPPILVNDSIIISPPFPPPLIPTEIPIIPEDIILKEIPPAPILPPLDLIEITKIIEDPVEIFQPCNGTEMIVPKVISINPIESQIRILEKDFLHLVPKQLLMKIIQIPLTLKITTSGMPDIPRILDEEETVVLMPPIPEIPALINPAYPVDRKFLQKPFNLSIPTEYIRDIIVDRVLPNIVINKKTFTKSMEFIGIPTAEEPVFAAPVFPNIIVKT